VQRCGVKPGERVAIAMRNYPEWVLCFCAITSIGAVAVAMNGHWQSEELVYGLQDCGARLCFVENAHQLAKVLLRRDELAQLERVIVLDELDGADDGYVWSLEDVRRRGAERLAASPGAFDAMVNAVTGDDLATLVYTSGTTGPPKGAMISHANIMATLRSLTSMIELRSSDRFLSFLPLSHITERSVSHFGQIASGGETWFARSLGTVPDDLRACRPTLFFAVPRVWEKLQESLLSASERGLVNPPPRATRPHDGSCASVLKLKWPAAARASRNMRCSGSRS